MTFILSRQPVSEIRVCPVCTMRAHPSEPAPWTPDKHVRRMHWRDACGVWHCEVCSPFRVEHETESASKPDALPPCVTGDGADTDTAQPPVTPAVAQTQAQGVAGGAPQCSTCKWWRGPVFAGSGYCKRRAPFRDGHQTLWPETSMADLCGEHEPRAEASK